MYIMSGVSSTAKPHGKTEAVASKKYGFLCNKNSARAVPGAERNFLE